MATSLIYVVIYIGVICLICGLLAWWVRRAPFIDPQYKGWIEFGIVTICVILIIFTLLRLIDGPVFHLRP